MKIQIQSKKGLKTILSIVVDKSDIKLKLDQRLKELQSEINLKGFRKGKVPPTVIKNQFGKAIYGEVIDKILKDSSTKAIKEKKLKVAGQPKIDLKTFGEGKDLSFELQLDLLPNIQLESFDKYKATDFKIKIDKKILDEKLDDLLNQYKSFKDKNPEERSKLGDQVTFDYTATVDNKSFEGSEGKGVTIELGKDLFLKDFDKQLLDIKKSDIKKVTSTLPANHPKKELANKKAVFECKIKNIQSPKKNTLNDDFAKSLGAENMKDLTEKVNDQISSQYNQALNSITKKEILDQIEKRHEIDIPQNLLDAEIKSLSQNPKNENGNKLKVAKSRIKLGLLLNEIGEKNKIKVEDDEIKNEIQKQVKSMPGQEKFVFEYYQKNPSAAQHLRGALYEEKIINLIKSKIKLITKELSTKEAEELIKNFNNKEQNDIKAKNYEKKPSKSKKISKK